MGKERFALGIALLLLFLGMVGGNLNAFDFSTVENKITDFTLDNGMKFIIMEDHSAPVISFVLQADVGGADDPKQAMGLAHMFEHMAFKGTSEIGSKDYKKEKKALDKLDKLYWELKAEQQKGDQADETKLADLQEKFKAAQEDAESWAEINEFSLAVENAGGVGLNAGTSYDNTTYYYSFPSNKLELWFYLESSRFSDPVLRQFYKEKEVIKEERRMRLDSSPVGRLVDEFLHAAFRAHPYGEALVGQMSEIDNYNKDIAMKFFKTHYVPSNMVVAMAGDVNPKEAKKLAEKYFGKLPNVPKPKRLTLEEPPQKAERIVIVPDESQPILLMGYHRPDVLSNDDVVFDAIADYLGQGRTSLLYKDLVKERKIATQTQAFSAFPGNKYSSEFGIFVVPAKGVSATECEPEVLAQIEKLKTDLIPQEELEKIKARAKANFVNGLASRNGMANQLVTAQNLYGDWHELFKGLDKINAVTAEDIQRVAREYFVPTNSTVAYIETEK